MLLHDLRHPVVDLRGNDVLEGVIGDVKDVAPSATLDDGDEIEWARERFSERYPQVVGVSAAERIGEGRQNAHGG